MYTRNHTHTQYIHLYTVSLCTEACPERSDESETACHGLCWASQSTERFDILTYFDNFDIKLMSIIFFEMNQNYVNDR